MGKSGSSDEAGLMALRDRILLTVQFVENSQGFRYGQGVREATETAFAKKSLRELRMIAREVDAMTIGLAPEQRDGLDALLRQRIGVDKDKERKNLSERVAQILRRGTIASEKERRRLEDYADSLEATQGDPAEVAAVRDLLRKV